MNNEQLKQADDMRYNNPMITAEIHRENLNLLRGRLGSKCTYLSFTRYRDDYGLKAVINGKQIDIAIGGEPQDLSEQTYDELYKELNGKD